jgi:hypothetical protein
VQAMLAAQGLVQWDTGVVQIQVPREVTRVETRVEYRVQVSKEVNLIQGMVL